MKNKERQIFHTYMYTIIVNTHTMRRVLSCICAHQAFSSAGKRPIGNVEKKKKRKRKYIKKTSNFTFSCIVSSLPPLKPLAIHFSFQPPFPFSRRTNFHHLCATNILRILVLYIYTCRHLMVAKCGK